MRGDWLTHQRFAVWGLGRSGLAVANLLARRGKRVVASDPGKTERPSGLHDDVEFRSGPNTLADAEVVVVSPGIPPSSEVFRGLEVPVVSEVEIAWSASSVPFLGITGTDGKTTTTELTEHLLAAGGLRVRAAGNIGTPLSDVVDEPLDYVVAELSAFQLWSTHDLRLAAAAVTNVAADHLDYFETWDEYVASKRRAVEHTPRRLVVLNWDDEEVRAWAEGRSGRFAAVSTVGEPDAPDAALRGWCSGGRLWLGVGRSAVPVITEAELVAAGIRGKHNVANVLMATMLASELGVGVQTIRKSLPNFRVGGHRIESVASIGGVEWVDDSKATNANAALAGIRSIEGPLVVIGGGVDKGIELDELAAELVRRAHRVVLIGQIAERFDAALVAAGASGDLVVRAESMQGAVEAARSAAREGDTVILSPACSSFDMFDSYAHRGELFQAAVRALT